MNLTSEVVLCSVKTNPCNQINCFSNLQEQENYFRSKKVLSKPITKYQDRSVIYITGYIDNLRNANYGFYKNKYNGTTKTFYFWIESMEQINKNTVAIYIIVDVFQTWYFNIEFNNCMIERAHVVNDRIGENTYPEDFELGDYITQSKQYIDYLTGDVCYFLAHSDYTSSNNIGSMFGQTYSGYGIKFYKHSDYDLLTQEIQRLCDEGKEDTIAFIFTYPQDLFMENFADYGACESGTNLIGFNFDRNEIQLEEFYKSFSFKNSEYTPYNNKLLTYPYTFLTVKNSSGSNVVWKFENFDNVDNITFFLDSLVTVNPTFTLSPCNYNNESIALNDSISETGYGLCSWNNDNYANWYAQHKNSIEAQSQNAYNSYKASNTINKNNYDLGNFNNNLGLASSGLDIVTSALQGNIGGALMGGISGGMNYLKNSKSNDNSLFNSSLINNTNYQNTMASLLASVQDAKVQPNTCKGDTSACGLDMARGTASICIEQTSIKPEYAKIIDMYFQMYGYKVNIIDTPRHFINSRKKWNYIKTVNCTISGDIPRKDASEIESIFNNGICIFHDDDLYNFNQKNEVK